MSTTAAEATPDVPSPQLFSLAGKNVLITGASRGIGKACAIALAQAGANLCFVVRDPASVIDKLQGAKYISCDLSDLEAVKTVFQLALDKMGGNIHVLVNCAGIQRRAPSVEFSEQDWDDVCTSQFYSHTCSYLLRY